MRAELSLRGCVSVLNAALKSLTTAESYVELLKGSLKTPSMHSVQCLNVRFNHEVCNVIFPWDSLCPNESLSNDMANPG